MHNNHITNKQSRALHGREQTNRTGHRLGADNRDRSDDRGKQDRRGSPVKGANNYGTAWVTAWVYTIGGKGYGATHGVYVTLSQAKLQHQV